MTRCDVDLGENPRVRRRTRRARCRATAPAPVTVDGEPPGDAHGADTDERGEGIVDRQRLYQLVREPGGIRERTFEITFLARGVEAYCFTFG